MKLNIFGKKEVKPKKTKAIVSDAKVASDTMNSSVDTVYAGSSAGKSVIDHIYTSEKSSRLIEINQYVFKVKPGANKNEIKKEVSARYGVKVKDVKILNVQGKRRDIGRYPGFRPGYRKAIVVLYPGSVIQQAKP